MTNTRKTGRTLLGIVSLVLLIASVVALIAYQLPDGIQKDVDSSPMQSTSTPAQPRQCNSSSSPEHPTSTAETDIRVSQDAFPRTRMINVGFEDITNEDPERLAHLSRKMDDVGATSVSISIGRLDWVGFPWPGHESVQSSEVRDTGRDYVREAIDQFRCDGNGEPRQIILNIDTLLGRELEENPQLAGSNMRGLRSKNWASISAWKHDGLTERLAALATEAKTRYSPDGINITELMYPSYTYGQSDLDDYRKFSNRPSWPRTAEGSIDSHHESIYAWKTDAVESVMSQVSKAVNDRKFLLTMDVRSPSGTDQRGRPDGGQNYQVLLKFVDRLNIWDFQGVGSSNVYTAKVLIEMFIQDAPDKYALEIGLWQGEGNIPDLTLAQELQAAEASKVAHVSLTPTSRFNEQTWMILKEAWPEH